MKKSDFIEALAELKLNNTNSYLVHVSLIGLGKFEDLKIKDINKFLLNSLQKFLGKKCTISTLTPFYEYADHNEEFDIKKSLPSKQIGSFSKFFFKKKNSYRSFNPLFNICSIGPNAKKITRNVATSDFGKQSTWENLYNLNTNMIFIGCDLSKCTFIRYIEHRFKVPYLINKLFYTKIKAGNKTLYSSFSSTLRNLNLNINYNTKKFQDILKKKGLLKISSNKNFTLMSVNMKPAFKIGTDCLKRNLYFFLDRKTLKKT